MDKLFDLIIIGAGPGGYAAAEHAAKFGMKTAVIEERELGGTCINRGCIPTKSLIYAARLYSIMNHCGQFGLQFEQGSFDLKKIFSYKDDAVGQFREGIRHKFQENGITYIEGHARVIGSKSVRVAAADGSETTYGAQHILIASGARPAIPPIPGVLLPGVVTSREVLSEPVWNYDRFVIIGGGVVGIEFATVFNALGAQVSVIEQAERLLPPMDEELSENLESLLRSRGIEVYTGAQVERITNEGGLACCFTQAGVERTLPATRILVAVGRRANIDNLTGENVSLETRNGRIVVNGDFITSIRGVYAVGDVIEGIQLAHLASAQGIHVVEKLAGKPSSVLLSTVPSGAFVDLPIVPSCIYIDPEIASVGISEAEAKRHGISVKCGRYSMSGNGKAIISKEESGFIKLVFEAHSRMLIGAQMICPRATDMIGELATAIANGLTARHLMFAMRAHPTFNEGIAEAIRNIEE